MTIDTQTRPPAQNAPARRKRRRSGRRLAALIAVPLILAVLAAFAIVYHAVMTQHRALIVDAPPLALTPIATAAAPASGSSTGTGQVSGGPVVDPNWIQQTSAMTGISARALEGYGKAQLQIAALRPGCWRPEITAPRTVEIPWCVLPASPS